MGQAQLRHAGLSDLESLGPDDSGVSGAGLSGAGYRWSGRIIRSGSGAGTSSGLLAVFGGGLQGAG